MQKILPALAFCFAAQAALADQLPAGHDDDAQRHAGGLMHASLVLPAPTPGAGGAPHGAAPTALSVGLPAGAQPAAHKEPNGGHGGEHTTGMLLAALVLMAGIVLRRWGSDPR